MPDARAWQRLASRWPSRAQVFTYSLDVEGAPGCDPPEFMESLLLFAEHPAYLRENDAQRSLVLSHAWLAYNQKQVELEQSVVAPACLALLSGELPGASDLFARMVVSETLTDESFHVLMIEEASALTRKRRDLRPLALPACHPVAEMQRELARHAEPWERALVLFATAIVSEVFVCSYLRRLAESSDIQPSNAHVTRAHLVDELGHGHIFRALARSAYGAMTVVQRAFFVGVLPRAIAWFTAIDAAPWPAILEHVGLPNRRALLGDCAGHVEPTVNFTTLFKLCDELDIEDVRARVDELVGRWPAA